VDEDCDGAGGVCNGDHLFSRQFDFALPNAVKAESQGRIALTGQMFGPQDFGGGPLPSVGGNDVFAAVYDANDAWVFANAYGDPSSQEGYAIAMDANGGVATVGRLTGTIDFGNGPLSNNHFFVARLDAQGTALWSKAFLGGVDSRPWGVAFDASGAVFVTGDANGGANLGGGFLTGGGGYDAFVVKLDASGNHVWSQLYGAAEQQHGMDIAVDGSGNVFVTGFFVGTIDFGGPVLSSVGLIEDAFLVKLDSAGNHLWTKQLGGVSEQLALGVDCDAAGNVVVAGYQSGTADYGGGPLVANGRDVFVARYAANGTHLWSKIFGDNAEQVAHAVALDGAGNVLVSGDMYGTMTFGGATLISAGERDIFVAKLSATGAHVWSKRFGDAGIQQGLSVAADATGRVALAGGFEGTINFGGATFMASGVDGFVARFEP
jgi:hypothetical protein